MWTAIDFVIPGRVDVYIDGVDVLSDINGHRDGNVVKLRGKIVNDSSFSDVNGRFEAVYDSRHRGRKINHRFHCEVNVIKLWLN